MGDDQTINLPQLVLIILLGGFAVRYFFFSTPQSPDQPSASSRGGVRVREADVDRVQQMFPQVPRRTIMWDLQRNGGNIAATTERILSGRGLEEVSYLHIASKLCIIATAQQLTPYSRHRLSDHQCQRLQRLLLRKPAQAQGPRHQNHPSLTSLRDTTSGQSSPHPTTTIRKLQADPPAGRPVGRPGVKIRRRGSR